MKYLYLLLLLLVIPITSAATLEGTIYDLSFNRVSSAIVSINTTPVQTKVPTNGDYNFNLPPGTYTVQADKYSQGVITESISQQIKLTDEGTFNLDLILYPITDLDEFEEINNQDLNLDLEEETYSPKSTLIRLGYILVILLMGGIIYKFYKRKKPYIEDELEISILNFIKEENTTSQKNIRTNFPAYSEAKISLIIKKLEAENKIQKYKKGRANIIVAK